MKRISLATLLTIAAIGGPVRAAPACTPIVLPETAQLRGAVPSFPLWVYSMLGDGTTDLGFGGPEPDDFQIEFYSPDVGTFDMASGDEANFATCKHCVLLSEDIEGIQGGKSYFPDAGALSISTAPGPQDLAIVLSGLRLVEVTIDPNTFISTPVPGGACLVQVNAPIFTDGFELP